MNINSLYTNIHFSDWGNRFCSNSILLSYFSIKPFPCFRHNILSVLLDELWRHQVDQLPLRSFFLLLLLSLRNSLLALYHNIQNEVKNIDDIRFAFEEILSVPLFQETFLSSDILDSKVNV